MKSKIYYTKPEYMRDMLMGLDILSTDSSLLYAILKSKSVVLTHQLIAVVPETDLNTIYRNFQGETWSPEGEAGELIKALNLNHTSMSVGDIVQQGNQYYFCDMEGWVVL